MEHENGQFKQFMTELYKEYKSTYPNKGNWFHFAEANFSGTTYRLQEQNRNNFSKSGRKIKWAAVARRCEVIQVYANRNAYGIVIQGRFYVYPNVPTPESFLKWLPPEEDESFLSGTDISSDSTKADNNISQPLEKDCFVTTGKKDSNPGPDLDQIMEVNG